MPFYEYECAHCKFYVEALQKISDPPLVECPSCGKPDLKRLVSAPNFRLKGSGWYETDFKSEKENKRNIAGGEEDKPSTEKESKEGEDSKPARISRRVAVRKADKKVKATGKKKAVKKKPAGTAATKAGKGKVKSQARPKFKTKVRSVAAKKKSVKKNAKKTLKKKGARKK